MSLARITRLFASKTPFSRCEHMRTLHLFTSELNYQFHKPDQDRLCIPRQCYSMVTGKTVLLQHPFTRYKHDKKKSKKPENEDSDDEDSDEDLTDDPNTKIHKMNVPSMRIDAVIKGGLGLARNKTEVALYESRIRCNGKKVLKKSISVVIGDVIDLIIGPSPKNPNYLIVSRITILSAEANEEMIRIKYSKDRSLLVENYEDEWEPVNAS